MYRVGSYLKKELASKVIQKGNNLCVKITLEKHSNHPSSTLNTILCVYSPVYVSVNMPFKDMHITIQCFLVFISSFESLCLNSRKSSMPMSQPHCRIPVTQQCIWRCLNSPIIWITSGESGMGGWVSFCTYV